jgi:Tfp pilus assembly protein PilZ
MPDYRHIRFKVNVPVKVELGKDIIEGVTHDLSTGGLFIRCDQLGQLRQLVKVTLTMPFQWGDLELHAMVVHVIHPGADRTPGMGLQFFGLDRQKKKFLRELIKRVQVEFPKAQTESVRTHPVDTEVIEPIRRRFPRFAAILEVEVELVDELVTMYTRDISKGGMLLESEIDVEVGETLLIQVVHPETKEKFQLASEARRLVHEPPFKGIAIEFCELSDDSRAAFWDFIGATVETIAGVEVVLLEEGHPLPEHTDEITVPVPLDEETPDTSGGDRPPKASD